MTAGCCGNRVLVCHVSWDWETRVADRFDPHTDPRFLSLVMLKREVISWALSRSRTYADATTPLRRSIKLTIPPATQTVPRLVRLLATLPPSFLRTTTPNTRLTWPQKTKSSGMSGIMTKTRSQSPKNGRVQSCAAQPDSRMCVIRNQACSTRY